MSIDLTGIPIRSMIDRSQDFAALLSPPLGGPVQRIERPGTRTTFVVTTPFMDVEPDGRRWAARLKAAKREMATLTIEQVGLAIGAPGSPTVAADTATGRFVAVEGMTPNYSIRPDQWLSFLRADGKRYLAQAAVLVTADGDGAVTIELHDLIRAPLAEGDLVEIARPKITGWLSGDFGLPRDVDEIVQFTFEIAEAE